MSNKQQTAVGWLVKELNQKIDFIPLGKWDMIRDIIEQAKEMEKEQRSIEVPSDEEIGKEASVRHYGTNFKHVFASGAKWMRDKIQGGNK
jgi:hypothetical protein